jgi:nicotinic acid mononucleotide adenylyltransferase
MSFIHKYLKYKKKYLNLKSLVGGSSNTALLKQKYIIIPGSFSPLTNAHLEFIDAAVDYYLKLGYINIKVIIVPVPDTYNKPSTLLPLDGSPPHPDYLSEVFRNYIIEKGLKLLRLKYKEITFILSTIEQCNKPNLSNTGLVVEKMFSENIISQNKEDNILFLGTDNVLKVPTWGNPKLMFTYSNLGIITREGESTSNDYATLVPYQNEDSWVAEYNFKEVFSGPISVYYLPTKEITLEKLKSDRSTIVAENMQTMPIISLKIEFSSSLLRKYVRQELNNNDTSELINAINKLKPRDHPFSPEDLYTNIKNYITYLTPATYDELINEYNIK